MKKIILLLLIVTIPFQSVFAQKKTENNGGGGGLLGFGAATAAVATIIWYEVQMREMVEQEAMEWALMNKDIEHGDQVEMKLIEWEIKSIDDISSTTNLLFKYRVNDEPYEVLMFVLSSGWWNDNGIIFTKVDVIKIDKPFWSDLMFTLMSTACKDTNLVSLTNDSIKARFYTKISRRLSDGTYMDKMVGQDVTLDISSIKKISGRKIIFDMNDEQFIKSETYLELVKIKGDEHIIGYLNNDGIILDYNEKRINLFNKATLDLIKLNQYSVNEIHRLLYREPFWFDVI
jgi:hypothetical protein